MTQQKNFTVDTGLEVTGTGGDIVMTGGNITGATDVSASGNVIVTGNISAGHVIGEAGNISNIQGANVSGAVGLATYATTANSVTVANVGGIGNIATVNLTGSSSNVLYGNGTFAAPTAGNTLVNGNSNVVVNANANVIISTNGNAAVADFGADGRMRMVTGAKVIGGNIAAGDGSIQFATSGLSLLGGNLQLISGGYIKGPAGYNVIQLNSPENTSLRVVGNLAVGASNTGNIYGGSATLSGNLSAGNISTGGIISATGNVQVGGQVSQTGLPAFRVYGSTSTVIQGGNTVNTVTTTTTIDYNQGSAYNNTTGVFTAPVAGVYHAFATVRVANFNGLNQAAILKNGTSIGGANVIAFWEISGNSATGHMPLTGDCKLAVGDTLRLQAVAGNIEFDANDSWGVTFVG
jgi:hypothetical protein